MTALYKTDTWKFSTKGVVGCRWLFAVKYHKMDPLSNIHTSFGKRINAILEG